MTKPDPNAEWVPALDFVRQVARLDHSGDDGYSGSDDPDDDRHALDGLIATAREIDLRPLRAVLADALARAAPPPTPIPGGEGDVEGLIAELRDRPRFVAEGPRYLLQLNERAADALSRRDDLAPRRVQKLRDALTSEGHAYEESLEREDGWIARCEAAERRGAELLETLREAQFYVEAAAEDETDAATLAERIRAVIDKVQP